MKRSGSGRYNKNTNKTMAREELLEKNKQRKELNTLTLEEKKTFGNPNFQLPKVGDFLMRERT